MICPLYRGCPLLRGSNCIILIGRDKFGDLVLSFVERYLIQCPFLGGSSLRGSTVHNTFRNKVQPFQMSFFQELCNESEKRHSLPFHPVHIEQMHTWTLECSKWTSRKTTANVGRSMHKLTSNCKERINHLESTIMLRIHLLKLLVLGPSLSFEVNEKNRHFTHFYLCCFTPLETTTILICALSIFCYFVSPH